MCTVNRKTRFLCTKKKYEDRYRKANAVRGKEEGGRGGCHFSVDVKTFLLMEECASIEVI